MVDSLTKNKPITLTIATAIVVVLFVIGTTWKASQRFQKLRGDVEHIEVRLDAVIKKVDDYSEEGANKEIEFYKIMAQVSSDLKGLERAVDNLREEVK